MRTPVAAWSRREPFFDDTRPTLFQLMFNRCWKSLDRDRERGDQGCERRISAGSVGGRRLTCKLCRVTGRNGLILLDAVVVTQRLRERWVATAIALRSDRNRTLIK